MVLLLLDSPRHGRGRSPLDHRTLAQALPPHTLPSTHAHTHLAPLPPIPHPTLTHREHAGEIDASNTLLSEAEEGLQGLAQRLKELEQGVAGSTDVTRLTSEVAYLESELEAEMEVGVLPGLGWAGSASEALGQQAACLPV